MSDRAPYSRVYWAIQTDEKFDGIRDDPRLMGSWLLMLVAADMAHPSPAYLVPTVTRAAVTRLVEAGLIDLVDAFHFRVHGLDAERERRAEAGRAGGLASGKSRTNVERTLNERSPNEEQTSNETKTKTETKDETYDGREDLEAFLLVKRRAPTAAQRRLLDQLLDRHDVTGPQWAADIILKNPSDPIGAVIEADKAWRDQRIAEARDAEKPKPQPRRSPGLPQHARELLAAWAESEDEKGAA